MDKAQSKVVLADVGEAIKAVYAKHGLQVTRVRATYDVGEFNLTVKAISAKVEDRQATWAKYAPVYGLPVNGIDQVVTINRKAFRIVGIDLSRRTFPVRVESVQTGEASMFKADAIRRALQAIDISVPA
jgi:hypothetical protein